MRKFLSMTFALLALGAVLYLSNPDFLGGKNITNTTRQIAMLGIFATGVGFVIVTGGIDLSVGSVIGLSGVIVARLSAPVASSSVVSGYGLPIEVGIAVALVVSLGIGLVQGLLITRLGLQPFIVTLAGMLLLRGVSQTITQGGSISFGTSRFGELANGGVSLFGVVISYPVFLCLVVVTVATFVLHFTVFGRHVFAIGGNRDAARYSGVRVERVELITYIISSGLAGLAGVVYASYVSQLSHNVGQTYELQAIAAAVLGGCSLRGGEGSIPGILVGSALMKVMENGINMFQFRYTNAAGELVRFTLDENWRFLIIGGVILGAVVLDQVTHLIRERAARRKVL